MPLRELDVKNLKVEFSTAEGTLTAVNGISYHLDRGETLAIVGESGCGKTMNALSILRLIPDPPGKIVDGQIWFNGRDILQHTPKELRELRGKEIAMIFQEPMTSLNPVFTVGEQIIETLLKHTDLTRKQAREKAAELLRRVDIPSPGEKINSYPHQLSGGMRQRVMIAMALSCDPRILITDEPTTALDVLIQAQILDLLHTLKKDTGMSILLITHDLGVVAKIAQRVLVMYAGEIVESGPVRQVLRSPLHPYTKGLIDSLPGLSFIREKKTRLREIEGNVPALNKLPAGCPFHPRCPSVEDRCKTSKPGLKETEAGHAVSCWLYE